MLFHKPMSRIENLDSFGFLLIRIVANDIIDTSTFWSKFLYQIFIIIFGASNIFSVLADRARLAIISSRANVGILIYPYSVVNPNIQKVAPFSLLRFGIVFSCWIRDNI